MANKTVANQAVIDAWADMRGWVEGTLPGLAQGSQLPNESQNVGDCGACNAFNAGGGQSGAIWGSDGGMTVTLSALKLTALTGVAIQPASFTNATTVQLPFSFRTMEVQGNYNYSQPCALYDFGKKVTTSSADGHGSVSENIANNTLVYVARFDKRLTLTSVVVNGSPSIDVHPDNGGLPDWLVAIGNFLSTFKEASVLRAKVQDVFESADFSTTLITLMNKKLGVQ